mmetsp:Transcript_2251/g.2526  ORF Transcript_2251/g.2526 Transcript_2251/m.2526 type:complete len:99 (+) Transcript_2251:84-380(+)
MKLTPTRCDGDAICCVAGGVLGLIHAALCWFFQPQLHTLTHTRSLIDCFFCSTLQLPTSLSLFGLVGGGMYCLFYYCGCLPFLPSCPPHHCYYIQYAE